MAKGWRLTIGILEVIGGVSGLLTVLWQVMAVALDTKALPLAIIVVGVYILSVIAGITLLREHLVGRTLSIVIQLIQAPKLFSHVLIFFFSFGFDACVCWVIYGGLSNLRIDLKFGAYHQLFINVPDTPVGIGFSIPACIFLFILLKRQPKPPLTDDVSDRA